MQKTVTLPRLNLDGIAAFALDEKMSSAHAKKSDILDDFLNRLSEQKRALEQLFECYSKRRSKNAFWEEHEADIIHLNERIIGVRSQAEKVIKVAADPQFKATILMILEYFNEASQVFQKKMDSPRGCHIC